MRKIFATIIFTMAASLVLSVASASAHEVDPPVKLSVQLADGERLLGWLTSRDAEGFGFKTRDGNEITVAWSRLSAERVLWVHRKVLAADDARGWFDLTGRLMARDDAGPYGEQALRRALAIEPALAEKAQRLRDGESVSYDEVEPAEDEGAETAAGSEANAPQENAGATQEQGPITVGDVQSQYWGTLSPEVMQSSVDELKERMIEAQENMRLRLPLYEDASKYFLFYSDLPPAEARQWAGLLDQMYDKLCSIFAVPRGTNLFRGRGLIIVFAREADYHRYQMVVHGFGGSAGTAGLCRSFNDGHAEVTFYRQDNQLNFARVLVHEAVHAFVHRYRSYPQINSWINEGLAEYVATSLVEGKGFGQSDFADSIEYGLQELRDRKSLGGNAFFYQHGLEAWQYPVAEMLTGFMIRQDRLRYRAFFDAIKDGKKWDDALAEDYGVPLERLVEAFGEQIKIRGLQP